MVAVYHLTSGTSESVIVVRELGVPTPEYEISNSAPSYFNQDTQSVKEE